MKKDMFQKFTEEEKIEALKEFNIVREEAKKEKFANFFRNLIFITAIVIGLVVLFRIFFGTIEIHNPFGYEKNRFYQVTWNEKTVTVWNSEHNRIPLIPWLVYFNSNSFHVYRGELENLLDLEEADRYMLTIKSYSCHDEKLEKRIQCKSEENHVKEIKQDTIYTLKIDKRTYNPPTEDKEESWDVETIYEGPFIEDVTKYIEDGAEYYFLITGKYGTVITESHFYINYNRGY